MRITVLGAGSWGTALAIAWASSGHQVHLWARREEFARELEAERLNRRYLPNAPFPEGLEVGAELPEAAEAEVVAAVAPSHGFREVVRDYLVHHPSHRPLTLVSCTKGVEQGTLARMSEVAAEEAAAAGRELRFAVLSGPTFAAELAAGMPTAAVIAAADGSLAAELREALATPSFRLYSSADVAGVELGGTAKNVIAIAAGVVSGLGLGHNTIAVLITRGLHEMTRLGVAYGGDVRTFPGLSGLGDLVLTCTGGLSRNRQIGIELAKGRPLPEILAASPFVGEGVRNSASIASLAERQGVEMPITAQMMQVVWQGKPVRQAVSELMTRDLKAESDL